MILLGRLQEESSTFFQNLYSDYGRATGLNWRVEAVRGRVRAGIDPIGAEGWFPSVSAKGTAPVWVDVVGDAVMRLWVCRV